MDPEAAQGPEDTGSRPLAESDTSAGTVQESEQFARSLFDSLVPHIAVVDESGVIVAVNRAWRDFAAANMGLTAHVLEGANYLDVCDRAKGLGTEGTAAFAAGIRTILAGRDEHFTLEYPCHSPDGRRWFFARATPFAGPGPRRAVITHHDITERKQVEQERERFFSISLELIGVIGFDGQMRRFNPSFERSLGFRHEEILASGFLGLVQPEDRAAAAAKLGELALGSSINGFECRCRHKDGSYRWISWTAVPVIEDGAIYIAGRDVTERIQAEEEILRLNAHLEHRLDRIAALRRIDTAITSTLDLRPTLEIVLDQVLAQLRVDAAAVLLFDPSSQTLDYATSRGFWTDEITGSSVRLGEDWAGRAALQRRAIHIPDLPRHGGPDRRVSLLAGEGFLAYSAVPLSAKGQIKGVLEIFHRAPIVPEPEWSEFLETLAGQVAVAIDNASLFENLQDSNVELTLAYDATIEGWSRALELRDSETEGHTQRVTELTFRLARAMGLSGPELVHIRRGALLHDIGKMGVPDSILLKPGPLDDREQEVMRRHPSYAFEMLSPITFLGPALDIPYCHHEKWDGTGYPRGLSGEQIPLAARIFAIVDIWDALRFDRPYRKGWPAETVLEHIRALAGTHLDPVVTQAFLELVERDPRFLEGPRRPGTAPG